MGVVSLECGCAVMLAHRWESANGVFDRWSELGVQWETWSVCKVGRVSVEINECKKRVD